MVCFAMALCSIDYVYKLPQMQRLDQDTQNLDHSAWMPGLAAYFSLKCKLRQCMP